MGEGLTHNVEIDIFGHALQLFAEGSELFFGYQSFCSLRAGAEGAISVADIGDLSINS